MPEQEIKTLPFWRDVLNRYRTQAEDIYTGIQNIPGSTFKNLGNIVKGAGSLAIHGPGIAYGLSPIGMITDKLFEGTAVDTNATEKLGNALFGMFEDYYNYYNDPENLKHDPMRPVFDISQAFIPFGKGTPRVGKLKNFIINKAGVPAAEQLVEPLFRTGNTATMSSALAESQTRGIPFNLAQTTETKPIFGPLQPQRAALLDPKLKLKVNLQEELLNQWGEDLIRQSGGQTGISLADEPGTVAKKLENVGVANRKVIESAQEGIRTSIFDTANNVKEKHFYEVTDSKGNKSIMQKEVAGPIVLNETYKTLNKIQDQIKEFKDSFLNQNPELYGRFTNLLPTIQGFVANPTAKTPTMNLWNKAYETSNIRPSQYIADLNSVYASRAELGKLWARLPEQSGVHNAFRDLYNAMNTDIYESLNRMSPDLGSQFKAYNATQHELSQLFKTPIAKGLMKESGKGLKTAQVIKSPLPALNTALGDINKFKTFTQVVGPEVARDSLIYDILNNGVDNFGHFDYERLLEGVRKHSDKIESVVPRGSRLKHSLGNFIYSVKAQNRLGPTEAAMQSFNMQSDKAISNVATGVSLNRPGLFGIGAIKAFELLFDKHALVRIVSDPDTSYLAAQLMKTPVTHPSHISRMNNFMNKLGKLNVIGQARTIDGDIIPVRFTSTGSVVPEQETAEWNPF